MGLQQTDTYRPGGFAMNKDMLLDYGNCFFPSGGRESACDCHLSHERRVEYSCGFAGCFTLPATSRGADFTEYFSRLRCRDGHLSAASHHLTTVSLDMWRSPSLSL